MSSTQKIGKDPSIPLAESATTLQNVLPTANAAARRAIYEGAIYLLPPSEPSLELVAEANALLHQEFGDDIRGAGQRLSAQTFFDAIGRIRKILFMDRKFHEAAQAVIEAFGFDPTEVAMDPVRLRVIEHLGHQNPRAAPVYYAHRDTWYAHSQSLIAWWIPLDDLAPEETFEFYPDYLDVPLDNESSKFEYEGWVKDSWDLKIGWQNRDAGLTALYPKSAATPEAGSGVGFGCKRGDNLLFSGAHFHRTLPQSTGRTRFSLDFRIVDLRDHRAGIGAPNVDNRSRGAALVDYVPPRPKKPASGS